MAKWIIFSAEHEESIAQWVASRPPVIQDVITRFNLRPDVLYVLEDSPPGEFFVMRGIGEDGTVCLCPILPPGSYDGNTVIPCTGTVFRGFDPNHLREVDLPPGFIPLTQHPSTLH